MTKLGDARLAVLQLLNSLQSKNWDDFTACFNIAPTWQFIDVLPGGAVIKSATQLIDLHPEFFNSTATCFEPLDGSSKFSAENFQYELSWDKVCQFGVAAKVIKPKRLENLNHVQPLELETIKNILNITMVLDTEKNKWFPGSITNTLIIA